VLYFRIHLSIWVYTFSLAWSVLLLFLVFCFAFVYVFVDACFLFVCLLFFGSFFVVFSFAVSVLFFAFFLVLFLFICLILFFPCLVCPMLPVSLDCPLLVAPSVFSSVYIYTRYKTITYIKLISMVCRYLFLPQNRKILFNHNNLATNKR